jgi:phosphoribosylformylglycinamidine cyclo-ligase
LPEGCTVELYEDAWQVPPIFKLIQEQGQIDPGEMPRVFNMGLGMALIVAPEHRPLVEQIAPSSIAVGRVVER